MKMGIAAAFGITMLAGAAPAHGGSTPKFSILSSWDSGHSTALDTSLHRLEVGDQMFDGDAPFCASILSILNLCSVPTRHFDELDQPVLPSGLTVHAWTTMTTPKISLGAKNSDDTELKTMLEELSDCDRGPQHKGDIPISCSFSRTVVHFSEGKKLHLIRMIAHPKVSTSYPWSAIYFTANSNGEIAGQFHSHVGLSFGGGTVFTYKGIDYFSDWSRATFDFSDGYEGRKFRRAKTTFEVASIHDDYGPAASRTCVFALKRVR